jgi:hypothetical protein
VPIAHMGIDIVGNGKAWVRRWEAVTFSPSKLFARKTFQLDSGTFQFAMGCFLLGYVCSVITCLAYFVAFYPHTFRGELAGEKLKTSLEVLSLLAGGYVVAMIVFSLCMGSVSYLVYRGFGSGQDFDRHFSAVLHLRNLEPVAAIAITLFLLQPNNGQYGRPWLHEYKHPTWAAIVLMLFLATRFYYIVLGWKALRAVHAAGGRNGLSFLLGFVPIEIIGALGFTLFTLVVGDIMVARLD